MEPIGKLPASTRIISGVMGVISSASSDGTAVDVGVAFVEVWGVQAPSVAAEAAIPTIFRNSRRESVRRLDIPCSSLLGMGPLSVLHDMNAQVFLKGQEAQLNYAVLTRRNPLSPT
jgi:hypothetical protein